MRQRMACKGFLDCLLKLMNLLLALAGLALVGYGIYLCVEYKRASDDSVEVSPFDGYEASFPLGRPTLMAVPPSADISRGLPKTWFLYLIIGIGVILFIISCFGFVGICAQSNYFLCCYAVLILFLIFTEIGYAGFVYFDKSWEEELPTDETGYFMMIYNFLKEHWGIIKWIALAIVILQVLILVLAIIVRAVNQAAESGSDDELMGQRQQIWRPLINRFRPPAGQAPDQRPTGADAWSTRLREKFGFSTSGLTYNQPSESDQPQQAAQPTEQNRGASAPSCSRP